MNNDKKRIHSAVYTRKSHEEGLDQDFNSLDAQRSAAEAYIQSQVHEGWKLLRLATTTEASLAGTWIGRHSMR